MNSLVYGSLILSLSAYTPVSADVPQVEEASFTAASTSQATSIEQFAKGVLSSVESNIQGRIASVFLNALLGSAGNNSVSLNEESIRRIGQTFRDVLVDRDIATMNADLDSANSLLNNYRAQLLNGNYNESSLNNAFNALVNLNNHPAFNPSINDRYFYEIQSKALVSTLLVAVLTEQYNQGLINLSEVRAQARALANRLEGFKHAAINHVTASIYQTGGCWYSSGYEISCTFVNNLHNGPSYFEEAFSEDSYREDSYDLVTNERARFISTIMGNVDSVISQLKNL